MRVNEAEKRPNKNKLSYNEMETLYYKWLDENFQLHFTEDTFHVHADMVEDEKLIVLFLNQYHLATIPAKLVQENEELVHRMCLDAAKICLVAGDRTCGLVNNPFRLNGPISVLTGELLKIVRDRAKELQEG